jgi:hypothetical protein
MWVKPAKSEHGKCMLEVKSTMIAHHWDGNKSLWIADALIPPEALMSGHDNANTPVSAISQQLPGGMNSQSGNLASNSVDAAANAAQVMAAQRSFAMTMDLMGKIGK